MKKNEQEFINQAELSRRLNVSRAYINKLVKNGTLVFKDKLIDFEVAKQSIKNNEDPAKAYKKKTNTVEKVEATASRSSPNPSQKEINEKKDIITSFISIKDPGYFDNVSKLTFTEARTRNEQIDLIASQIKLEKEMNILVSVEEMQRKSFEVAKKLRDSLSNIPNRLCDRLVVETNAVVICNIIKKEIDDTLNQIIEDLNNINNKEDE